MFSKSVCVGDYKLLKTIGKGAFSTVKLGKHRLSGEKVAIKIIEKTALMKSSTSTFQKSVEPKKANKIAPIAEETAGIVFSNPFEDGSVESMASSSSKLPDFLKNFNLEIQLLMRLDHPNIAKLYQVYETPKELYIIMQYLEGGEMVDYLTSKGFLSEFESRKFFRQLVSALDHCHSAGVVHRDLKLENLLLTKNKDLVMTDFGLGSTFDADQEFLKTCCGTPLYAPPEIVCGEEYDGQKTDVWSSGVVLYWLLTGFPPFRGENISSLYKQIKRVDYYCPETFSVGLVDLFSKIFVRDPAERISIQQLRLHPWLNEGGLQPPTHIDPLFIKDDSKDPQKKYYSLISGITHDDAENVIYHFASRAEATECSDNSLQEMRRKSAGLPPPSSISKTRRHTLQDAVVAPCTEKNLSVPAYDGFVVGYRRRTFQGEEISSKVKPINQNLKPRQLDSPSSAVKEQKSVVSEEIRTLRLSFTTSLTSSKPPAEIINDLEKVLKSQLIAFDRITRYILNCEYFHNTTDLIAFEVEVFKVRLLPLHGLRFKFCRGNVVGYKQLYSNITKILHL